MAEPDAQLQIDMLSERCRQLHHALAALAGWLEISKTISPEQGKRINDILMGDLRPHQQDELKHGS